MSDYTRNLRTILAAYDAAKKRYGDSGDAKLIAKKLQPKLSGVPIDQRIALARGMIKKRSPAERYDIVVALLLYARKSGSHVYNTTYCLCLALIEEPKLQAGVVETMLENIEWAAEKEKVAFIRNR